MTTEAIVFKTYKKIFVEYQKRELKVIELCRRYGISRQTFYKRKRLYEKYGDEGLKPKKPRKPKMPTETPQWIVDKILAYIKENPTHGPQRIADELKIRSNDKINISHGGVWKVLHRQGLSKRKERLRFFEQTLEKATEILKEEEKKKKQHIEADYPGDLIGQDTFYVGTLKGIGRVYMQTTIDYFSNYGWARLGLRKTAIEAVTSLDEVICDTEEKGVSVHKVLTDNGKEYTTHHNHGRENHLFERACTDRGLKHKRTRVGRPQSNGGCEKLNQTIWDEFFSIALRKKRYESVEELQNDLAEFMWRYNYKRPNRGRRTKGRPPAMLFLSGIKPLALPKAA